MNLTTRSLVAKLGALFLIGFSASAFAADKYVKVPLNCPQGEAVINYYNQVGIPDDGFGNSFSDFVSGCNPNNISDPYLKKSKLTVSNSSNNAVNSYPYSFEFSSQLTPKLKVKPGVIKIKQKGEMRMANFAEGLGASLQTTAGYQFIVPVNPNGPTSDIRIRWTELVKVSGLEANDTSSLTNYLSSGFLRVYQHVGGGVYNIIFTTFSPQSSQTITLSPGEYVLRIATDTYLEGIGPQNLTSGKQPKFSRNVTILVDRKI